MSSPNKERETQVYMAKLAEQAERYEGLLLFLLLYCFIYFFSFLMECALRLPLVRCFFFVFVFISWSWCWSDCLILLHCVWIFYKYKFVKWFFFHSFEASCCRWVSLNRKFVLIFNALCLTGFSLEFFAENVKTNLKKLIDLVKINVILTVQ